MLVLSAVEPGRKTIRFLNDPLAASDARIPAANESSTESTSTTTATTMKVSVVLNFRTKRLCQLYASGSVKIIESLQVSKRGNNFHPQSQPRGPDSRH